MAKVEVGFQPKKNSNHLPASMEHEEFLQYFFLLIEKNEGADIVWSRNFDSKV